MPKKQDNTHLAPEVSVVRYAIYTRFSHDAQNEASLASQEMMCRRAVAERGGRVVEVFADAGQIGWNLDRAGFQAMREAASRKRFDAIMMWKFDRLARDHTQATVVKTLFRQDYGVKLYCVEGLSEDDDSSPYTAMMEQMMSVIAGFYSRNLSTEIKRANVLRYEQGKYKGSSAPLGYLLAVDKTPTDPRMCKASAEFPTGLHIIPREAAIVRRAFKMYATGKYSYQDIADWLMSKSRYLTLGDRVIGIDWVRVMLGNRLYLGEVGYAETIYKDGFRQKMTGHRGRKTWRKGIHQPIIDEVLFDACQRARVSRSKKRGAARAKRHYLLAGKVWCGRCLDIKPSGLIDAKYGVMRCHHQVQKYSSADRYECVARDRGYGACGQKIVKCSVIDAQVIDALMHAADSLPDDIESAVNESVRRRAETVATIERMNELTAVVRRIDLSWEHGFIGEKEYVQKRLQLKAEIDALQPVDFASLKENALALHSFGAHWHLAQDAEQRQRLIDAVVERVIVRGDKVEEIVLRGQTSLILGERE